MFIFFNFGGRLNRQPFLILCFALLGIFLVVGVFFLTLLGGFANNLVGSVISGDVENLPSMNVGLSTTASVVSLILMLLIFVSTLSLCVRRLHDRDKSGWWLLAYYLVSIILGVVGINMATSGDLTIYFGIVAIQFVLSLWFFIELCFLRGTNGPNLYGSDPMTGSMADSAIFS